MQAEGSQDKMKVGMGKHELSSSSSKSDSKNKAIQKRKNQKIDNVTKQLLIRLTVIENRCSVYFVAKKYGINYQNAKAIVRKYKRNQLLMQRYLIGNMGAPMAPT